MYEYPTPKSRWDSCGDTEDELTQKLNTGKTFSVSVTPLDT